MATAGLLWLTPHLSAFIITSSEKHLGFKLVNTLYTTLIACLHRHSGNWALYLLLWTYNLPLACPYHETVQQTGNSQIKQSPIVPGAQAACRSQSDSKRGEIRSLQGLLVVQSSSLVRSLGYGKGKLLKFSSTKGMKTYGMLCCASLVHRRNTWVLEDSQTLLWHGDDDTAETLQNSVLLSNFPDVSRNILGCAKRTTKGFVPIPIRSGFTPLSEVKLSD